MNKSCVSKQFFKFSLVGAINTIIGFGSYYCFLWLDCNYILANMLSWIISVFNAFYWNNKYVFQNNVSWWKSLIKTYISYATSLICGTILLFVLVEYFEVSTKIAPICTLLLTVPMNFLFNKYWTFN